MPKQAIFKHGHYMKNMYGKPPIIASNTPFILLLLIFGIHTIRKIYFR
ncbi:hypothetical protein BSM4216_0059 [Bacillus smithii]|nr:hypothetical protein BSM4216_0059 [Bacillus smithii]